MMLFNKMLSELKSCFSFKKEFLVLPYFATHIVEHCNLGCKGCDHCVPLAKPGFADPKNFDKDFRRLAKLFDKVLHVGLMGGEPLLHPDLTEFFDISRRHFPNSSIKLFTNGIILGSQNDKFWAKCRENDIEIAITVYPINVNYAEIEQRIMQEKVLFSFRNNSDVCSKTLYKNVFDLEGSQNPDESYNNCFHISNFFTFLDNGKFYPCTIVRNSVNFSKYFNKNLEITTHDSINIHKVKSGKDILDFFKKPIPFCKYCKTTCRTYGNKWERSKREITEWI